MFKHFQTDMTYGPDSLKNFTNTEFLLNEQLKNHAFVTMSKSKFQHSDNSRPKTELSKIFQPSSALEPILANRVNIAQIMKAINVKQHGKYFLCRTITPTCLMNYVHTVLQDPEGIHAVRINFDKLVTPYHYRDDLIPIGTILAIKNPEFWCSNDGGYALIFDEDKDVVLLGKNTCRQMFPEFWRQPIDDLAIREELKIAGNKQFAVGDFKAAIENYSEGINVSQPPGQGQNDSANKDLIITLLANRSAAYLNFGQFLESLADAESVLAQKPFHLKAIHRKAKSLFGLNRFEEGIGFLEEKLKHVKGGDGDHNKTELFTLLQNAKETLEQHNQEA